MMKMRIIPDSILEVLICSSCKKYLSVKPIKALPDGQIFCGRCVETMKDSRLYINRLSDDLLFSCINKFDGCRELVSFDTSRQHEKTCVSQQHMCPVCCEELPTYLIWPHFQEKHKGSILPRQRFQVCINSNLRNLVLLYKYNDDLILIHFGVDYNAKKIRFCASFLTTPKVTGTQSFILNLFSENEYFNSYQGFAKPIINFMADRLNPYEVTLPRSKRISSVRVEFRVTIKKHLDNNIVQEIFSIIDKPINNLIAETYNFIPFLDGNFEIKFPFLFVKDGILSDILLKKNIHVPCKSCQIVPITLNDYINASFVVNHSDLNLFCEDCGKYELFKHSQTHFLDIESILHPDIYFDLKFYCRWNCGSINLLSDIYLHESQCTNQFLLKCIYPSCHELVTTDNFVQHAKECHQLTTKCQNDLLPTSVKCGKNLESTVFWFQSHRIVSLSLLCYRMSIRANVNYYDNTQMKLPKLKFLFFTNDGEHIYCVKGDGDVLPFSKKFRIKPIEDQ